MSPAISTSATAAACSRAAGGACFDVTTMGRCEAAVKNGVVQSRLQRSRHDGDRKLGRAIGLGPHRPGGDQHDVGQGTQRGEDLAVGGAAEPAGQPVHRGGAVDTGDHVEPHRRSPRDHRQIPVDVEGLDGLARFREELAQDGTG